MFVSKCIATILLLGVALTVSANSVYANEEECPQICPALYAPVCAGNGKIFQEFDNSCLLRSNNCRLQRQSVTPFVAVDVDWCNTALVQNLNDKFDSSDLERPECLKPCPLIYSPVCVSNGTYRAVVSNTCLMEIYNCALAGRDASAQLYRVLQQGSC